MLEFGEHIDIRLSDGRIMVVHDDGRTAITAQAPDAELPAIQDFTITQACAALRIGRTRLYGLLSSRNGGPVLPSRVVPGRGRVVRREDLVRLMAEGVPR